MSNEDWNTVGDRHGEREPALRRDVAVRVVHPQPACPIISVGDNPRTMNLGCRGESSSVGGQLFAELSPSLHDEPSRFI